ncbi:MAG: precorrin-6y C5,15-methyltransferase (decarboxylating) subunit CbiE [Magnetococcales bacterium]|nr:precorrin-6y C5,15-methyltransferase (decarboxylating) subunit CbiE [Magnetococcales bacterium]
MAKNNQCIIIGVLDGGLDQLTPKASRTMAQADLIIADDRFLKLYRPNFKNTSEQCSLSGKIKELPELITAAQNEGKQVVVLATGDPLFHGIAGYLIKKLPKNSIVVMENVSTIQVAFSRLGISWSDAKLLSIHAKDGGDWQPTSGVDHPLYPLFKALFSEDKIALLTSPANTPNRIAKMLLMLDLEGEFLITVAQELTSPTENIITNQTASQILKTAFISPNVVILLRCKKQTEDTIKKPLLGIADSEFLPAESTTALITKQEIRVVSLAYLSLQKDSIVWDIGAGSGSVGLEAARLANCGEVYAMEKNQTRLATISENRAKLQIANYQLFAGTAPEGLTNWPDPDAVFIGGSGGSLAQLIKIVADRLKDGGRLVMNFITLENLNQALVTLKKIGMDWQMSQIQVSRSAPILAMNRLVPESPVFIVAAKKAEQEIPT